MINIMMKSNLGRTSLLLFTSKVCHWGNSGQEPKMSLLTLSQSVTVVELENTGRQHELYPVLICEILFKLQLTTTSLVWLESAALTEAGRSLLFCFAFCFLKTFYLLFLPFTSYLYIMSPYLSNLPSPTPKKQSKIKFKRRKGEVLW